MEDIIIIIFMQEQKRVAVLLIVPQRNNQSFPFSFVWFLLDYQSMFGFPLVGSTNFSSITSIICVQS